jgi:diaminohydroxyphosphoribosylaminopyrimidine deaminase/5-amino-6-(5-phosphoribosylamino)uracil reductase
VSPRAKGAAGDGGRKPRATRVRAGEAPDDRAEHPHDLVWMARCIQLARRAEGRTAPNPMVGCVIVGPGGEPIAEGFHERAGAQHAEVSALDAAGARAAGATMYVNLEPCNHRRNRRTAPCAPRVAAAGLARLVIGMGDPIRGHAGGAGWLAKHGVAVTRGVLRDDCRELNRAWICWAVRRRPWFALKAAATLDGRIATGTGESRWITGAAARRDGHRWRDRLDAVMVGVGTVLADDPRLTARDVPGGRDPVRVVVDSKLRTPPTAALLPRVGGSAARTIVATTAAAPAARERRLVAAGAEVWRLKARGGRVELGALSRRLAEAGITSVLVEGGAELHAALLTAGLGDEVLLYLAPAVLGGRDGSGGPAWVGGEGVARLADAHRLRFVGPPIMVGDDLFLTARPVRR